MLLGRDVPVYYWLDSDAVDMDSLAILESNFAVEPDPVEPRLYRIDLPTDSPSARASISARLPYGGSGMRRTLALLWAVGCWRAFYVVLRTERERLIQSSAWAVAMTALVLWMIPAVVLRQGTAYEMHLLQQIAAGLTCWGGCVDTATLFSDVRQLASRGRGSRETAWARLHLLGESAINRGGRGNGPGAGEVPPSPR